MNDDVRLLGFLLIYVLKKVGPVELPSFDFDEWVDEETFGLELNFKSPAGGTKVILSVIEDENPSEEGRVVIIEDGVETYRKEY